jgi:hypothetical protein
MLLLVGASTSALTYLLLYNAEEEDFQTSVSYHLLLEGCGDGGGTYIIIRHV